MNFAENFTAENGKEERFCERFGKFNPDVITIEHAWAHYETEWSIRRLAKETRNGYERFYKKFISSISSEIPDFEKMPVKTINDDVIKSIFIDIMEDNDLKDQTINYYLRAYKAFGRFCEEEGYLSGFKLVIRERDAEIKELYSKDEIKKLLKKPDYTDFVECRNHTIVSMIFQSGARSNTILNIKMKDISLEDDVMRFNTTKSGRTVELPIIPELKSVLIKYISHWRYDAAPNDYLFVSAISGKKLSRGGLADAIATYNKSRGVNKTSLHLMRHTFANNWMMSTGGDLISLQYMMTHSTIEATKRYTNFGASDIAIKAKEHSVLGMYGVADNKAFKTKKKIA